MVSVFLGAPVFGGRLWVRWGASEGGTWEQVNPVYKQTYKQLQRNSRGDTHQLQTENGTEKRVEDTGAEFRENLGKLGGSVCGEVAWEP